MAGRQQRSGRPNRREIAGRSAKCTAFWHPNLNGINRAFITTSLECSGVDQAVRLKTTCRSASPYGRALYHERRRPRARCSRGRGFFSGRSMMFRVGRPLGARRPSDRRPPGRRARPGGRPPHRPRTEAGRVAPHCAPRHATETGIPVRPAALSRNR
jgi:hypothetical protein